MLTFVTKQKIEEHCIDIAAKSRCAKRKVGAVLTLKANGQYAVLAEGVNWNPDGSSCELPDGSTKESVIHAEAACIHNASGKFLCLNGRNLLEEMRDKGELIMFVSHYPCDNCKALLAKHNLSYIVCESFMKFSSHKPRMALVPASLGIACARALTYGAKKYKPNNWRKTETIEDYISAITRHIDAWREGEENDPESGLCHLDHAAANLSFLIELKHLPKVKDK
ncbi:MAG: hypothetical protein EOM35_02315 [Negativicutes bacterium]|nr:hypothetical protein [Negativicutes bacterium]